ncbi:hypothetical protein B5S33_g4844 [[Candida] boidinii]|nr:hypothetical protein B5S30_g3942 [[Candida] boidinii]OWB86162.1 hypothetical protein B5S33_g4844 [[Candida] boidinii]
MKFKTSFKMAISKLRFIENKKTSINKQQRRQMAELLSAGKEESAKVRVENIIRDDILVELLEYLELYCELLLARINLLISPTATPVIPHDDKQKEIPKPNPGLEEAIQSIIFATPYTEVKELNTVRDLLVHKFGKEYSLISTDLNDEDNKVPERIRTRCDIKPPGDDLVRSYLSVIATAYNVPFSEMEPEEEEIEDDDNTEDDDGEGDGGIKEEAEKEKATGIAVLESPLVDDVSILNINSDSDIKDPIEVSPPAKTTDNRRPSVTIPKGVQVNRKKPNTISVVKKSKDSDFDDLKKRFEALKKS